MFWLAFYIFLCTAFWLFLLKDIKQHYGHVTVKDFCTSFFVVFCPILNIIFILAILWEFCGIKAFWNKKLF